MAKADDKGEEDGEEGEDKEKVSCAGCAPDTA